MNAAERLARLMARDILSNGFSEGALIASEPELLERYAVSRPLLRAAARILEHDGVARMRRGPSGGLIATYPRAEVVTHAAEVYLQHLRPTIKSLVEARIAVEAPAVELAAARVQPPDIDDLRERVKRERSLLAAGDRPGYSACAIDFHVRLAQISQNDALSLFVNVLVELNAAHVATGMSRDDTEDAIDAHELIAEAVIARDGSAARHHLVTHLSSIEGQRESFGRPWDAS